VSVRGCLGMLWSYVTSMETIQATPFKLSSINQHV